MPKISMHLGITLPIPGKEYSSLRQDIEFNEIDTSGDIKAQLEECINAVLLASEPMDKTLSTIMTNSSGLDFAGAGLTTQFELFKEQTTRNLRKIVNKIKENADNKTQVSADSAQQERNYAAKREAFGG